MTLRRRYLPRVYAALPAGSARAAPPWAPLRRPPSPPYEIYSQRITVPIGNDGVAAPAIFSAAGIGQASAGPSGLGASWEPAQAVIFTSIGPSDIATAMVWAGPAPLQQYQKAGQLAGGNSRVPLTGVVLVPGWRVWVQWAGGTPGTTGYLVVDGVKYALTV